MHALIPPQCHLSSMAPSIATPEEAYSAFFTAWDDISAECCAVLGSEVHYQAMIYHALRVKGSVPQGQLGMNVKIWLKGAHTSLFKKFDQLKHPDYQGGYEPIPDVAIFHEDIKKDWRRRNYKKTAKYLLLAVEVKASERELKRLFPAEIIRDIEKLNALRAELRWRRHHTIVPVMVVIDTAPEPEERMTKEAFEEVMEKAAALSVHFFYCGPNGCFAPSVAAAVPELSTSLDSGKGVV